MGRVLLLTSLLIFGVLLTPVLFIEAAATGLSVGQNCSNGAANVTFSWTGHDPSSHQQWLDLSTSNSGWAPGTFIGAGPLGGPVSSFTWTNLLPGTRHYVRINQQLSNGTWDSSSTWIVDTECELSQAAQTRPESSTD